MSDHFTSSYKDMPIAPPNAVMVRGLKSDGVEPVSFDDCCAKCTDVHLEAAIRPQMSGITGAIALEPWN